MQHISYTIYLLGCETKGGAKCVFPFKYDNKTFLACTDYGHDSFWCSTSNNADGSYKTWAECDVSTCGKGNL